MTIRLLQRSDLSQVAEVHLRAFPEAAVSLFGGGAARRFYDCLLTAPHEQEGIGAFVDDRLVGFAFGGRANQAERYFLRRNLPYLSLQLVRRPWLLLRARVLGRMRLGLRILLRRQSPPACPLPSAEILEVSYGIQAIAVDPAVRRSGVGSLLLQAAETSARHKKFPRMALSVHASNDGAIRFYERHGWVKWERNGAWGGLMLREFDQGKTCA